MCYSKSIILASKRCDCSTASRVSIEEVIMKLILPYYSIFYRPYVLGHDIYPILPHAHAQGVK